jgi:ABC-type branched-subunit amino acid transport system substrate-binding protein
VPFVALGVAAIVAVTACGDDKSTSTTVASTAAASTTAAPGTTGATVAPATTGAAGTTATPATSQPTESTTAGSLDPNAKPFKIALIGPLTGGFSVLGGVAGAQTAIKELSDTSGILGRPIQFETYDSQSTADGMLVAARQALDFKPDVIVFSGVSAEISAAADLFAEAKVPVISSHGTDVLFDGTKSPWHLAVAINTPQTADSLLKGAASVVAGGTLSGKKVAVIGGKTPATDLAVQAIQDRAATDGFDVVAVERDELKITSFAGPAANIVAKNPDVVIDIDTPANHPIVGKDLITAGLTVPIINAVGAATDATFAAVNSKQYYSVRFAQPVSPGSHVADMATKYGTTDASTGIFFPIGYSEVFVAKAIAEQCGPDCAFDNFIKTAETMGPITVPNNAMYGPVQFSATTHSGIGAFQLIGWDGSKIVPIGDPISLT